MTFADLGLHAPLLRAVAEAGYTQPTEIQRAAIPSVLAGRDLVGCAQTGTGKTAAFALPLLQRLDDRVEDDPAVRALVLTPTRELAAQISESFATYGRHLELWHTAIYGGVAIGPQKQELSRGVDALVATPGRLLDLLEQRALRLDRVEIFVLDEADRMLDMGFLPDVRRIIRQLPTKRQTLLFSATMPPEIRELSRSLLHEPVHVATTRVSTPAEGVDQRVMLVDKARKRTLLLELLRDPAYSRTLVFSRTKHAADRVAKGLASAGISAAAIHGNKSQNARTRALEGFRDGSVAVLCATDLAARGLDVEGVTHVVNFDLPNIPETYVHRIGRTARAGSTGVAVSFCDVDEREFLRDIEKLIGRPIPRVADTAPASSSRRSPEPPAMPASRAAARPSPAQPPPRRRGRGRSGRRGRSAPARGPA
jgi:ATP-dependent RNA helicase RhlE